MGIMVIIMLDKNKDGPCNRTGHCCYMRWNGKKKKCPHLAFNTKGLAFCKIYYNPNRIGKYIGKIDDKKFYCNYRCMVPKNFLCCPQNKKEWEPE